MSVIGCTRRRCPAVVPDRVCEQFCFVGAKFAGPHKVSKYVDRVANVGRSEPLVDQVIGRVVVRDYPATELFRDGDALSFTEVVHAGNPAAAEFDLDAHDLNKKVVHGGWLAEVTACEGVAAGFTMVGTGENFPSLPDLSSADRH